jgi:hypothetical protein
VTAETDEMGTAIESVEKKKNEKKKNKQDIA